jgi:predicted RNase H-like nuclease (RuvC/YqgF family)
MNKQSALMEAWQALNDEEDEKCPDTIKVLGRSLRMGLEDYGRFIRMPERDVQNLIQFLEMLKQENEYLKQKNMEMHGEIAELRETCVEQAQAFRKYRTDYDRCSNYEALKQKQQAIQQQAMSIQQQPKFPKEIQEMYEYFKGDKW